MGSEMAKHAAPRGENGTMTAGAHKTATYDGRHRAGEAKGTAAQQPAGSDLPPRGKGL